MPASKSPVKDNVKLPSKYGGAIKGFPQATELLTTKGLAVLAIGLLAWMRWTTLQDKKVAFMIAATAGAIEWGYTQFRHRAQVGTTPERFFANLFFIPLMLPFYYRFAHAFLSFGPLSRVKDTNIIKEMILAFWVPVFIWTLELVQSFTLTMLFGYNRAWQYEGHFTMFRRSIKLSYYPLWIALGFTFVCMFQHQVSMMSGPFHEVQKEIS